METIFKDALIVCKIGVPIAVSHGLDRTVRVEEVDALLGKDALPHVGLRQVMFTAICPVEFSIGQLLWREEVHGAPGVVSPPERVPDADRAAGAMDPVDVLLHGVVEKDVDAVDLLVF